MFRSLFAFVLVAGCVADPEEVTSTAELDSIGVTRTVVAGDVAHYEYVLRVGNTPNAQIHVHRVVRERAPWVPRRSSDAVLGMHGDFAKFTTNYLPSQYGLAAWLAMRDVDVWGLDRRWATTPVDGDLSDFDAMSLGQELDDIGVALAFARAVRLLDGSTERLNLIGFSRGGELAYFYASREATRPAALRHVKGIVPLDVYVSLAPEDEEVRQFFCEASYYEYLDLTAGVVDTPNDFQIAVGTADAADPDGETQIGNPGRTNRQVMMNFLGRTYRFGFPASPFYHLAATALGTDGFPLSFRESSAESLDAWLINAPLHESLREAADTDAMTCGDAPPLDLPLSRIRVPLFLIAAAGGYGAHALHSTTQVGSSDVQTLLIRTLPVEREAEDYGHGDLLFAPSAEALAWQPLLAWLRAH
jgi:pimeloyl-ACP methyl ester carboxylesterase